jgi:hypothetical protein
VSELLESLWTRSVSAVDAAVSEDWIVELAGEGMDLNEIELCGKPSRIASFEVASFCPLSPGTSARLTGLSKKTYIADVLGERAGVRRLLLVVLSTGITPKALQLTAWGQPRSGATPGQRHGKITPRVVFC